MIINLILASHNIERISSVAEKLSTIQLHLKNERVNKLDKLDTVIQSTGEKLLEFSEDSHNKFGNIREQLSKLYQQIEQQNQYFDSVYEEKMQYLKLLEEKVVEKFEEEAKVSLLHIYTYTQYTCIIHTHTQYKSNII